MKIEIKPNEKIEVKCYSKEDNRFNGVYVMADGFGRLSFKNINYVQNKG